MALVRAFMLAGVSLPVGFHGSSAPFTGDRQRPIPQPIIAEMMPRADFDILTTGFSCFHAYHWNVWLVTYRTTFFIGALANLYFAERPGSTQNPGRSGGGQAR